MYLLSQLDSSYYLVLSRSLTNVKDCETRQETIVPHCALGNNKAPAWKERQQQRMGLGAACDSSRMRRDVSTSKWDKSGWKSAKIQRSGCFVLAFWSILACLLTYMRRMAAFLKTPFLLSVLHCALSNQTIGPYGCNQDNQPPTRYSLNIYWPKVNKMLLPIPPAPPSTQSSSLKNIFFHSTLLGYICAPKKFKKLKKIWKSLKRKKQILLQLFFEKNH